MNTTFHYRCKTDVLDEDLDEGLDPKILDFDATDNSFDEKRSIMVKTEEKRRMISPIRSAKRKYQATISPNFLNGLQIEPPRKLLSTIDNTASSMGKKKAKISTTTSISSAALPYTIRKRDHDADDGSKKSSLPTVKGRYNDLKCIAPDTLVAVLSKKDGQYDDVEATIVDCRYPYEFQAGHISGALNLFTQSAVYAYFLMNYWQDRSGSSSRSIVIFHCEFSSERGPNLAKYLRNEDRELHKESYPTLHFPEIYILHGGYKEFFHRFKNLCSPPAYLEMAAKGHESELAEYTKAAKLEKVDQRNGTLAKTSIARRYR